ncbi:hypothetical protein PN462_19135 [Spirulina sp. CS-785/01]|uniref:hypothetical protein n=1 Tax=Spirulina sp. CS-785/01 TaxID=3021716 RepID=UPI00232EC249|nr:hypothetical protein [Spirulina sp. CS-785/01]MDB9315237.1 hypothetical protein [Spirulina sp. CS-785/01]
MKYFFLSEGWGVGRVWEFGGLWNESVWRRRPDILRLDLGIIDHGERLWLYQVEEAVLMIEVRPLNLADSDSGIGQVVLKRLISAEQAIAKLMEAETVFNRASA